MSDMDSNIDSGASGVAASQTSGENAKLNSDDAAKIVAEVLKQLDPVLDKKVQSVKDRRIESLEQRYAKALEKQGMAPEDAKAIADRLPKPADTSTKPETEQPSGKVVDSGTIADKVLEASGLKLDDPNVLAFKQQTFANESERLVEVAKLVAKMANPQPASQAATPPPTGQSKDAETQESLTAKLNALNRNPVGNLEELKRVKKELAQFNK
jgi:hypothetical protein